MWKIQGDSATCIGIYKVSDGYIVHGELEISKIDSRGNIIWKRSGRDIFTTLEGIDNFRIENNAIYVTDWQNNTYCFDVLDGTERNAAVL